MVISLRKGREDTHTNKRYLTFSSASPLASTNFRTKMIIIIITKATFAGPGEPENTATVPFLNEIHLKRKRKIRKETAPGRCCLPVHTFIKTRPEEIKAAGYRRPGAGGSLCRVNKTGTNNLEQTNVNKTNNVPPVGMKSFEF
jgi:hypothetical protein